MKLRKSILLVASFTLLSSLGTLCRADVTIVEKGQSSLSIVVPQAATESVQKAAEELQKDIEIASGALLKIEKDDVTSAGHYISLGSTSQATAAGVVSEKMADESYRIVTKDGSLFILGPDTAEGEWTARNGTSHGTANGVYSFLEEFLDVRWLMPGEIGRDVPKKDSISVAEMDRSYTPPFNYRRVSHLYDYATQKQVRTAMAWGQTQKQGGATAWDFGHNWWRTLNRTSREERKEGRYPWLGGSEPNTPAVKAIYEKHPEWFAMDKNGERPFPKNHYAKLETTNQELVRWFAEQAIETLKASPRPIAFSLSPSDGSGWSLSPESTALYDSNLDKIPDPEDPLANASMSSLIAKWYHDIAEIVAKEYPEGNLTGYLYASYINPPEKVAAKLPENFTPQIATSRAYGYGLYRPEVQEYFKRVTGDWSKIITGDWYYYDLPTQLLRQSWAEVGREGQANFPGSTGIITPAAPGIVDFIFPQLLESHITGAGIYGVPSFSNAALSNYILAKMEWDPSQKAADLQRDWLQRAYGSEAGHVMERFYAKLEDHYRAYYQQNENFRYELGAQNLKDLYTTAYPEIEKIFLEAKVKSMSEVQKQRLQLIEDNLTVLQWRLRNVRGLPDDFASPLRRSDAQISELIAAGNEFADFQMFPGLTTKTSSDKASVILPKKVALADSPLPEKTMLPKWDDGSYLIYAAEDGDIEIATEMVIHGSYAAAYEIKNRKNALVTSGVFNTEKPIVIPAKAGDVYTLNIPYRKPADFQFQVRGAAVAAGHLVDDTLYLAGPSAPVYVFHIPGENPAGLMKSEGGAKIRKPYHANFAQSYRETSFTQVRHYEAFDSGWRFQTDPEGDGQERGFLQPDFDDSQWSPISPLDWWQLQGFPDYHGTAWYRTKFNAPALQEGEAARLFFGAIDGNAEIYLNGFRVGTRELGPAPEYKKWNTAFTILLNRRIVEGENSLVVKVTSKNDTSASGIFRGVGVIVGIPVPKK